MTLPAPAPERTAVVTGASSGIGAEIARELARRGQGVTLVARRTDRLQMLADELVSSHGVRAEVIGADLTRRPARMQVTEELAEAGLEVSILVNNAGFSTMGPVSRSDPDREVDMVRTNVEAVVHLTSLLLAGMVERHRGGLLNVVSTAAFQPLPGQAGYGATKAFVLSYTQALRAEVAGSGVSVTALCPGPVETGFAEAAGIDDADTNVLPKLMWVDVATVARAGVDGLAAGRAVVIPGLANRLTALGGHLVPRKVLLPVLARQHPSLREKG